MAYLTSCDFNFFLISIISATQPVPHHRGHPGTFIAIPLNGRVHREAMRAADMRIGCGTLCWLLLLRLGSQRFGFDFGEYGHSLIVSDHHVQGLCRLGYVHRLYIHIHIIYICICIVFIYVSNAPFQGEQSIKPSWLFTFPVTSALMRCRTASILVPWPKRSSLRE